MKHIKASLKINMEQATLTSLLMRSVNNVLATIKTFNPDPAIELWLSSAKTKRHVLSQRKGQATRPSAETNSVDDLSPSAPQDPPLPQLEVHDSEPVSE